MHCGIERGLQGFFRVIGGWSKQLHVTARNHFCCSVNSRDQRKHVEADRVTFSAMVVSVDHGISRRWLMRSWYICFFVMVSTPVFIIHVLPVIEVGRDSVPACMVIVCQVTSPCLSVRLSRIFSLCPGAWEGLPRSEGKPCAAHVISGAPQRTWRHAFTQGSGRKVMYAQRRPDIHEMHAV